MFAFLNRLFASFGRLADSVEALASTTDAVNAGLRERLGLDDPAEAPRLIEGHAEAQSPSSPPEVPETAPRARTLRGLDGVRDDIVRALMKAERPLSTKQIARLAGRNATSSHFREVMSSMKRDGLLIRPNPAARDYWLASRPVPAGFPAGQGGASGGPRP